MLGQLGAIPFVSLLANGRLLSVAAGHFVVDAYANLLPMMYPLLSEKLDMNYSQIGLAIGLYSLSSSLSQPVFGLLADKHGGRHFASLGVAWTVILLAALGFAWDYISFVVILTVAGFGTAAFHPQGAMNTSRVGGPLKATAMSVYMLGGTAGFALGPVIGAAVFGSSLGLRGSLLLAIPGLMMALWLYRAIGRVDATQTEEARSSVAGTGLTSAIPIVGVIALVLVVMLRSWTSSALTNYIPLLFKERELSMGWASQVLFVSLIAMAVGSVVGASMADAWGNRRVLAVSLIASAPAVAFYLAADGWAVMLGSALSGLLLGASMSITLVMGQELLPNNLGLASGLILGFAFATGGLGVSLIGFLADQWGLTAAVGVIWVLPIVAAAFCFLLRKPAAIVRSHT